MSKEARKPYEKPAIIYEGEISIRAGSPPFGPGGNIEPKSSNPTKAEVRDFFDNPETEAEEWGIVQEYMEELQDNS